jgi:phosphatidylinositol N-acetylglucosaminyltransferase subunit A
MFLEFFAPRDEIDIARNWPKKSRVENSRRDQRTFKR